MPRQTHRREDNQFAMLQMNPLASASGSNTKSGISLSLPEQVISDFAQPGLSERQEVLRYQVPVRSLKSLEWIYRSLTITEQFVDVDGVFLGTLNSM